MKAYMLITISTGQIEQVVEHLRRVDGVIEANMAFGPYDAVAVVKAEDIKALGKIMAARIQPIPGVIDTLTCLVVDD
jgi:DNA-binding Lrp family transcriptional regulator